MLDRICDLFLFSFLWRTLLTNANEAAVNEGATISSNMAASSPPGSVSHSSGRASLRNPSFKLQVSLTHCLGGEPKIRSQKTRKTAFLPGKEQAANPHFNKYSLSISEDSVAIFETPFSFTLNLLAPYKYHYLLEKNIQ